jgi:hypothetical protein
MSGDVTVKTSVQILLQMVQEGRFTEADKLRADLVSLDIPIPPNHIYEKAAKYALHPTFHGDRLTAFSSWFSLLPDATDKPRKFRSIHTKLFARAHIPQLDIIMQFGLIAASKGHAEYVFRSVIPPVIRLAEPTVSIQYLADFEKEAMGWRRGTVKTAKLGKRGILILKDLHSLAVRSQVVAGRLEEAVTLLQTARDRGVNISGFTYKMLMQRLHQAGDEQRLQIVKALAPHHIQVDSDRLPPRAFPTFTGSTLVSQLRILRNGIKPSLPITIGVIPHKSIVEFIRNYKTATGRETAIVLLRHRALSHPTSAIDWALVEMLYHRSRDEHRLVLAVFNTYFYLVGVPAAFVQFYAKTLARDRMAKRKSVPEEFILSTKYDLNTKLLPTPYHTAIVWAVLVRLIDPSKVENLYLLLLSQARQHKNMFSTEREGSSNLSEVPTSPTSSHAVDGAHFTPFLLAFTRRGQINLAIRIMEDMVGLGMQPSEVHWSILAGYYARYGDAKQAMELLDSMENQAIVGSPGDAQTLKFPAPSIETYTNLLVLFIHAKRLKEALDVKTRLMTRCRYSRGKWPATDRALSMLEAFELRTDVDVHQGYV